MPFTRRRRSRRNMRLGRSLRKWGGGKCKKCNFNTKKRSRKGRKKRQKGG